MAIDNPLKITQAAQQAALTLNFLVIGGSIAGLSCAIALRRVGHRVVVLERDQNYDDNPNSPKRTTGCRLPPNLSKILYGWGLESELRKIFVKSDAVDLNLRESGEFIGGHVYSEEVLKETRGEFIFGRMGDLRRLLRQSALSIGAEIRMGATVASLSPDQGSVTLATGQTLSADIIIGADGINGLSRQYLLEMSDSDLSFSTSSPGAAMCDDEAMQAPYNMYSTIVPRDSIMKEPELAKFYQREKTTLYTWFGDKHAVLGFSMGPNSDFAMFAYGPKDGNERSWDEEAPLHGLVAFTEGSEPRLRKLGKLASFSTCLSVDEHPPLEDWLSGRLLAIGAAVHPIAPGSPQDLAMAIEDGAVLAQLFSHIVREDQIDSFLCAFQDVREPRCKAVQTKEVGIVHYMTMGPSEFQSFRDDSMRAKRDAGINVLDPLGDDLEESPEWAEMKEVFGYDAEDEADEWYVTWGRLRERAKSMYDIDAEDFASLQISQTV